MIIAFLTFKLVKCLLNIVSSLASTERKVSYSLSDSENSQSQSSGLKHNKHATFEKPQNSTSKTVAAPVPAENNTDSYTPIDNESSRVDGPDLMSSSVTLSGSGIKDITGKLVFSCLALLYTDIVYLHLYNLFMCIYLLSFSLI